MTVSKQSRMEVARNMKCFIKEYICIISVSGWLFKMKFVV